MLKKIVIIFIAFADVGAFNNGVCAQAVKTEKQSIGYGGSLIYNFHANGFGADLRMKIPVANRLSAVPEFSYFPAFNDYHEFYAGLALHYEIARLGSYNLYLL